MVNDCPIYFNNISLSRNNISLSRDNIKTKSEIISCEVSRRLHKGLRNLNVCFYSFSLGNFTLYHEYITSYIFMIICITEGT